MSPGRLGQPRWLLLPHIERMFPFMPEKGAG